MSWFPSTKIVSTIEKCLIEQRLDAVSAKLPALTNLVFGRRQFALSIARTQTLMLAHSRWSRRERQAAVKMFVLGVMGQLEAFMEPTKDFSFATTISILADEARTSLASKVGAGVSDLTMENLGFFWRANAREFFASKRRGRIPDFVYDPAEQHGYESSCVIAVEAKGSISRSRATVRRLHALARSAYNNQVRSLVNHSSGGITIASGYAVAFGTIPGQRSSSVVIATPEKLTVGEVRVREPVSLSAAARVVMQPMQVQTHLQKQQHARHGYEGQQTTSGEGGGRGGGREGGGGRRAVPNGRLALASYESVFELCGAWQAADRIRIILSGRGESLGETMQRFYIFEDDRGRFLVGKDAFVGGAYGPEDLFAIYEPSARAILDAIGDDVSVPPTSVTMEIVPDELRDEDPREILSVVQGDGLAYVTSSPPRSMSWSSRSGWLEE
jgi:hypothetical protein